jgi:tRNA threonylcarbamoyladenosine biosynthesis protein TsaB
MILAIKTAEATAEIYLLKPTGEIIKQKKWLAERSLSTEILTELENMVDGDFGALTGLLVFRGPGSFTGLRIGIATMNTIAYAQKIPIVGATGEQWLADGVQALANHHDDRIVLPEYGGEANITKPRK